MIVLMLHDGSSALGNTSTIQQLPLQVYSLEILNNEDLKTYFSRHLFSPLRNTSSSFCLGSVFDLGAWLDM